MGSTHDLRRCLAPWTARECMPAADSGSAFSGRPDSADPSSNKRRIRETAPPRPARDVPRLRPQYVDGTANRMRRGNAQVPERILLHLIGGSAGAIRPVEADGICEAQRIRAEGIVVL